MRKQNGIMSEQNKIGCMIVDWNMKMNEAWRINSRKKWWLLYNNDYILYRIVDHNSILTFCSYDSEYKSK